MASNSSPSSSDIAPVHDGSKNGAVSEALDKVTENLQSQLGSPSKRPQDQEDYGIVPWVLDPFKPEDAWQQEAQINEGWQRKAHDELQEKMEWRERDIQALRDTVQAERSLKCPTDDAFLLKFLRAQKFDYDRAFQMLRRYFNMRRTYPQNFTKALPSLATPIYAHHMQTILPQRDRHGRRIFLFRAGSWDPYAVSPSDIFAANFLMLELIAREPKSQIAGLVMVVDMAGFTFGQIMHVTTEYVKSVANIIQSTFPLRFREIHIINESYLFDFVFQLIKPFLSETIRSRIVFHGENLEKLHDTIDPSVLPQEFGGKCGPLDNSSVVDVLKESEQFYRDLTTYGYTDPSACEDTHDPSRHPFQSYCLTGPLPEDD